MDEEDMPPMDEHDFVFELGPFAGKSPSDPSIRTGELERVYKRLNKAAHPRDAQAMREELARRKLVDDLEREEAQAVEDLRTRARQAEEAEAQAAPSPRQFWKNVGMPMPCGHPVSDLDWADQKDHTKGTRCAGCAMINDIMGEVLDILPSDSQYIGDFRECLHKLDQKLRAHLSRTE